MQEAPTNRQKEAGSLYYTGLLPKEQGQEVIEMTKAERIFRDTYTECRKYAKTWGFRYNPDARPVGFNGLITEEVVYVRTLNSVQKFIDRERKNLARDEELDVLDADRLNLLKYALDMVQVTLDNSRKNLADFELMLA